MSSGTVVKGVNLSNLPTSGDARYTNYLYIEGTELLKAQQKRELAGVGVKIFEYLGNNVYLCSYEPADLEPVRKLSFIKTANVYPERLKVSPFLNNAVEDARSGRSEEQTFNLNIVLHKGAVGDDVINQLVEEAGLSRESIEIEHNYIRVEADTNAIAKIQKLDQVKSVERVVEKQICNNLARDDICVRYFDAAGGDVPLTYEGNGQTVAVADTGFDKGKLDDVHEAFKDRVVALFSIGRPGKMNDPNGHGTHCAGSILGDGESQSMGGSIRGTAPKAKLVLQSLLASDRPRAGLRTPLNLWDLFNPPYADHSARVASNSWGPDWEAVGKRQLEYDSEAGAIDRFVWHRMDHVIVFAAGNDGQESSDTNAHIGSSSAAKNCICVGATESSRPNSNFRYVPTARPGNPDRVAAFSSRGPTLEQRLKPDVVAPGVAILSAASRDLNPAKLNVYGPTQDNSWMFSSGTSMATPLVSGCAAVLREALASNNVARPSAALVKALLVNGAINLGRPHTEQGFGRVDLSNSLGFVRDATFADEGSYQGRKLAEDETWSKEITAAASGTLKVTLAYSDRYGAALQNNLSLKVNIGDVEKRGDEGFKAENNIERINYAPNNVERVSHSVEKGEKVRITVTAESITRLDDTQAFAVVWGVVENDSPNTVRGVQPGDDEEKVTVKFSELASKWLDA